jgi:hypothetical protein
MGLDCEYIKHSPQLWVFFTFPDISFAYLPTMVTLEVDAPPPTDRPVDRPEARLDSPRTFPSTLNNDTKDETVDHSPDQDAQQEWKAKGYPKELKEELVPDEIDHLPGYFGMKGWKIIYNAIYPRYKSLVRDPEMYVEAVMVLKVTAKLVEVDMNVSVEEARKIVKESRFIGNLLWEHDDG